MNTDLIKTILESRTGRKVIAVENLEGVWCSVLYDGETIWQPLDLWSIGLDSSGEPLVNDDNAYDAPPPREVLMAVLNFAKEQGHEINHALWVCDGSADFYAGMYAACRMVHSFLERVPLKGALDLIDMLSLDAGILAARALK